MPDARRNQQIDQLCYRPRCPDGFQWRDAPLEGRGDVMDDTKLDYQRPNQFLLFLRIKIMANPRENKAQVDGSGTAPARIA